MSGNDTIEIGGIYAIVPFFVPFHGKKCFVLREGPRLRPGAYYVLTTDNKCMLFHYANLREIEHAT